MLKSNFLFYPNTIMKCLIVISYKIFNFSNIQPNIFISNLTKPINKKTKKTKINTFQKISIDDPQNVTIFYLYTDFSFPKIKIIFNILL